MPRFIVTFVATNTLDIDVEADDRAAAVNKAWELIPEDVQVAADTWEEDWVYELDAEGNVT